MSRKGFTLIETLIAMMILAGAIVALSQSWSGSLFAYRKAQNLSTVMGLLKKKVVELEIEYKARGFASIPEDDSGEFEGYPDITWQSEVKPLEFPDVAGLLSSQDQAAGDFLVNVVRQMTDYFSQNIKEMKVTVNWKSGPKSVQYSIVTYLTNEKTATQLPTAPAGGGGSGADVGGATGP